MSSSSPSDATGPIKTTGLHVGEPAPGVAKTDPIIVAKEVIFAAFQLPGVISISHGK